MEGYNGYENFQTWNVALWINNDEGLYHMAKEHRTSLEPYSDFATAMRDLGIVETPDGVSWTDSGLDIETLDELIEEL